MTSLRSLLARLLPFLGFTASLSSAAPMTLDEATASEFFRWFHLERVAPEGEADAERVRLFRPQGAKFRALAAVELSLGDHERVSGMRLRLKRSFIADPRDSSFARDIAKSFLLFAAAPGDRPALMPLVDEIQFRDLKGTILMRSEPPPLAPEPSAAYRAFAGEPGEARLVLPGTAITFTNRDGADGGELVVSAQLP